MPTYKDVDEIRKEIEAGKKNLHFKSDENAQVCAGVLAFVEGVIDRVPESDVERVKHGEWKYNKNGGYICSECDCWLEDYYGATPEMMNYCFYCGAKMDGKEGRK